MALLLWLHVGSCGMAEHKTHKVVLGDISRKFWSWDSGLQRRDPSPLAEMEGEQRMPGLSFDTGHLATDCSRPSSRVCVDRRLEVERGGAEDMHADAWPMQATLGRRSFCQGEA